MDVFHTADFESPIGALRVASSERGLAYLQLPHADGRGFGGWLERHAPGARVETGYEPNRAAIVQIIEFLEGKREAFEIPLDLRGTPFQLEVLEEVARIPYGESRSYLEIAQAIGRPTATRPVGAANGANPIPLVVPCHRVIGSHGQLQGYAGGLDLKARLLAMEQGQHHTQGRLL